MKLWDLDFGRELRSLTNEDLLTAMNVAKDPFVTEWSNPRSLQTAREELDVLDQIDGLERSDRDKCELILCLLHRDLPLDEIRSVARPRRWNRR